VDSEIDQISRRFADAAGTFLKRVEGLSASEWRARSIDDGRPIGTIAHHVALGFAIGHWRVIAAASGYPQPSQQGTAAERNLAHAVQTQAPDREATVLLLRSGAAALEAAIRSLHDEQLETEITFRFGTGTIRGLVEATVSHVLEHEATVRKSLGPRMP
jgi:hypothetical protein